MKSRGVIPASMKSAGEYRGHMKVKITRRPYGVVNGMSLSYYRPGEVYDLPATLAEYLVMEHYAILEMRDRDKPQPRVEVERRRRA